MDREAESGHEMTEATENSMDVALLNSEEQDRTQATPKRRGSKFRHWLRQARLQLLLFDFLRFKSSVFGIERRKIAIYHSRRMAALHALFHLIPVSGAITLLALHWTRYWAGYTPPDSTSLQFVAKLHELLMQFSIVEVTLCVVRTEAVHGFVPLGLLSGAVQTTQLSYLWSLDFLSVITSSALRGWRKVMFIVVVPALIALTTLVGPSSAVLMIPRPGSSDVTRVVTRFLNQSMDSLYPSYLDKSHGLTWDFPSFNSTMQTSQRPDSDFEDFPEGPQLFSLLTQGVDGDSRILRFSINFDSGSTDPANATMPTRWSSDSFWRIVRNDLRSMPIAIKNGSIGVEVAHPVVGTQCKYSFGRKKRLEPGTDLSYYHDDKTTGGSLANLSTLAKLAPGSSEYNKQRNIQSFAPLYMASPEPGSHSMIVVLFEFYPSGANATLSSLSRYVEQEASQDENRRLTVSICTVSAYWNFGEVLSLLPGGPYVVQTGPRSMSIPNKPRPITLNLTGVDELEGANFQGRAYAANPNKNAQLSIIFATVIANMNTSLVFPDPAGGLNRERAPDRDSSNSTELTYTFTRWGYGYNTWSTSIQLSIAVITAYCIVTLAYISYILTTGSTSTAWNSAIELVALALQSRKPDCLGHVGVGLDSLETFKEGVGIRVNNDNELELVFAHDREFVAGNLRKIERNKEY